jgi:hypothetical protein
LQQLFWIGFHCFICYKYVILLLFEQWRPLVLPDRYIEHGAPKDQFAEAGLTAAHIAATALNVLGKTREALQLMS